MFVLSMHVSMFALSHVQCTVIIRAVGSFGYLVFGLGTRWELHLHGRVVVGFRSWGRLIMSRVRLNRRHSRSHDDLRRPPDDDGLVVILVPSKAGNRADATGESASKAEKHDPSDDLKEKVSEFFCLA
eukprot:TRINITY_DN11490_c0_g1_i3.p2 TRINITY_DN11490_c0_g1~~TRINITY_DN11490_c0_g1_i3.p2  ORF type:complete len:128 (+),score=6.41 TRINITY_DN11490_c0_g1_i3:230-613(+)